MDAYVGTILAFGFDFAPRGWAMCQGQLLAVSTNQALFALIGTIYGGNGTSTFQLPNLQGRMAIGMGQGAGLSLRNLGAVGGVEAVSILQSNMPAHTHVATFTPSGGGGSASGTLKASGSAATQSVPGTLGANVLAALIYDDGSGSGAQPVLGYNSDTNPSVTIGGLTVSGSGGTGGGTVTNALTGNGLPMATMSPYLVINYCIALQGIFPTRN